MKPTFGSAFAGIGGFELGLERAGWHCKWQIENDKFCNKILKKHWPDVGKWLDVRNFEPEPYEEWAVDLICGGFPCQDLSVAGKRGGLSGERSGLFWELVRMARELQPRWLLIENVPGFLSSNEGEDFAFAIETLAECGYGLAWRVLDSQYFGVPQRRRRVFIVGHLGAMCPPEILFESEGGEGDIAEGGKAGEGIAYSLAARPGSGGGARLDPSQETLIATPWDGQGHRIHDSKGKAPAFRTGKGRSYGASYIAAGFSAGQSAEAGSIAYEEERSPTLRGEPSGTNQVPCVIEENTRDELRIRQSPPTVSVPGGKQKPWVVSNIEGVRPRVAGPALGRLSEGNDGEKADPNGVREASGVPRRVDLPLCYDSLNDEATELCPTMGQNTGLATGRAGTVMAETKEGLACPCPDSPRYRALGNAVTVQVAEWIGRRILEYGVR